MRHRLRSFAARVVRRLRRKGVVTRDQEVGHPPVTDWATDFDHTDAAWTADPYQIWDELRTSCPVAHTDRYGGAWLPTKHADVASIIYDTGRFTSRTPVVSDYRPPKALEPRGVAAPITSDPPYHRAARRVLRDGFSPPAIAKLEPSTRAYCTELIEALRGRDAVDAATEYAQHIPTRVVANMVGLPVEDADKFREFVRLTLELVSTPGQRRSQATPGVNYFARPIEEHRNHPRDDFITVLLNAELDGRKLEVWEISQTLALLVIAGVDTTWSAIGASLWHLAKTPPDRQRLVDQPALLPTAVEELLRAYAPVTAVRLVNQDMDWHGCAMKAEDWVLLPLPAANRDPARFDRADEVVIDRPVNRHATFGLGIHRCLGSHLARMELRVALEVWLQAFPDFHLADPDAVTWSQGQVRGPRTLPLHIVR